MSDNVEHPSHYTSRNIGHECIDMTECQTFCVGNTIKYLWRFNFKGKPLEDLQKAKWYAKRASALGQKVDMTDAQCIDIIKKLVNSTEGFEQVAWKALESDDWHMYIDAIDRIIEKLED